METTRNHLRNRSDALVLEFSARSAPQFPWPALLTAVLGGFPALVIGVIWAMSALGIDGQPDDVLFEMNGDQYPGVMETSIAVSVSVVLGALGVVALLRFWKEFTTWLRGA